ncbi:MAG: HTH-type transcriptional regulator Mce2R [Deltaproteobacteria bacterium ADurb.Bin510]|nr:MAG: HTH-type transcriptional regulator Mce2R [Deltaproteobacteria bacterium ADurb.Bin510]
MPASKPSDKLNRSRLHEEIVTLIQTQILKGEIAPGAKLPTERELAEKLNVNRSTVREALRKLESQELLDIRHGDGVYARDFTDSGSLDLIKTLIYLNDELDVKVLKDLLVFRRIFVPDMAAIAAQNRSTAELENLERIVNASPELSVLERDLSLHRAIAKATHNLIYIIMLNFFNKLFLDFGYLYFDRPENRERSSQFHRDILEAIASGDAERSRSVMDEVLAFAEDQINGFIDSAGPRVKGRAKHN